MMLIFSLIVTSVDPVEMLTDFMLVSFAMQRGFAYSGVGFSVYTCWCGDFSPNASNPLGTPPCGPRCIGFEGSSKPYYCGLTHEFNIAGYQLAPSGKAYS